MSRNRTLVPEAAQAMEKFKMESAKEVGGNLTNGYNGDLTSREAGSVGGQMVNNICPVRKAFFTRNNRTLDGHMQKIWYEYQIVI